jgi:thiol-disulfide isomerase/thioredoxin
MHKIIGLFLVTSLTMQGMSGLLAQPTAKQARLHGKLTGFSGIVEVEHFSEIQHMVPKSYNPTIVLNADSTFEITVPLEAPAYFRIGRSKLYLSPGDDMDVFLDHGNSEKASFTGTGSLANNYLKRTPFPKGGSYLEAGRNVQESPEATLQWLLAYCKKRTGEAEALKGKGVSEEFIRLEKARNRADLIISIRYVRSYAMAALRNKPEAFRKAYVDEFDKLSQPILDSLRKDFVDPSLLQLEAYRDLYNYLMPDETVTPQVRQQMEDYYNAYRLAFTRIKPLNDKKLLPDMQVAADSIQTKKYRDILHLLIQDKMKFGNGDVAIDLDVISADGTTTTLSSLKGKVIYIDVWATWCGPCLAAMPHLEALKKKYATNNQVSIVSLSIDDSDNIWLKNLEKRKPGGIQWRIDRARMADYGVETIPRYILIDKNFTIAELNAPEAADPDLSSMIDSLLKK